MKNVWKFYCIKFLEYFDKYYNNDTYYKGWQRYIKFRMPSTNNALESLNRTIKETATNYEKLEFGEFMNRIWNYVKEKSLNAHENPFYQQPFIPNEIKIIGVYLFEIFEDLYYNFFH